MVLDLRSHASIIKLPRFDKAYAHSKQRVMQLRRYEIELRPPNADEARNTICRQYDVRMA